MTVEELLQKEGGREAIIKLASALEKKANTQFNETVPAVAAPTQNETASNSQVSGAADPTMVAQAAAVDPNAPVVDPAIDPNAMPVDQGIDPGMEGALAAQSFLAPIMEAAMNGDPNAQAIIAQAAGSIAKGIAEAAAGVSSAPMVAPAPAAAPVVSAATPEDQVADAIVPEQKPEEKAPPVKDEGQEKKASFTASQIKGLLDLARAGKI